MTGATRHQRLAINGMLRNKLQMTPKDQIY